MAEQELAVIQKTYDLVKWMCERLRRFPRQYRYSLGARIESGLYDVLEVLIQARYSRQRQELLRQANRQLEVLRYQMRLALDLACWRTGSYGFATQGLHDIGCMVGGWLRNGQ